MAFEKTVLNTVAQVLKRDRSASFTCGCLFVDCDEQEARRVFHRLSRDFGTGKIQINGPIQGEYAYDFV
jgi:hypothetical protein